MNPFGMSGPAMKKMVENAQNRSPKTPTRCRSASTRRGSKARRGRHGESDVSGSGNLIEVAIAREAVDPDDVEMLQDLVVTAVREALEKAKEMQTDEQQKILPAT
jgi:DNA-binding protein YbaB